MKTVCVLMSVYNGEKYLREQVESILNQEGVKVYLLIRDDGSIDSSLTILDTFGSQIQVIHEKNVGIIQSYSLLVKEGINIDCDYYAFSDQDDIWDKRKLLRAVELLDKLDSQKPALYFSNLEYTDENIRSLGLVYPKKPYYTKKNSLIWNYAYGCTEVFNRKAAEMYCKGLGKRMWMHDYWLYLIGMHLGNCYYDDKSYISYRQHGANSVGFNHSIRRKLKNKLSSIKKLNESPRIDMAEDFLTTYSEWLSDDSKIALNSFIGNKYSFKTRMSSMFDKEYYVFNFIGNAILRFRFLIGAV